MRASLKKRLMGTAVKCESVGDYNVVKVLYGLAGANLWSWHRGFKEPVEDENECPWYGWEHCGFLKHIHPVAEKDRLTINQLYIMIDNEFRSLEESKKPKGKLTIIEGMDGVGKTTQSKLLVENLIKEGKRAIYVKFPFYNSPTGTLVKRYLNNEFGSASGVHPVLGSALYMLDRAAHKEHLEQCLKDYDHVILDRYFYSNMALQGAKDIDKLESLCQIIEEIEVKQVGLPLGTVILLDAGDKQDSMLKGRDGNESGSGLDGHESSSKMINNSGEIYAFLTTRYNFNKVSVLEEGTIRAIDEINNELMRFVRP